MTRPRASVRTRYRLRAPSLRSRKGCTIEPRPADQRRAQKQLAKIPGPERGGIIAAVLELAQQPRPEGVKELTGREAWRIRVANYRIIDEIHEEKLVVLIMAIGHRRDIYRS